MSDTNTHLDSAMIEQLKELLGSRFAELIQRFVNDGENRLGLLKTAVTSLDYPVIYSEAHGLKGSARNLGAGLLGDLCAKLEASGKDEVDDGLQQTFAAVEQEFAAVCAALRSS